MSRAALTAGQEVTVRLVKSGDTKLRYPAVVAGDDGTHAVVRAPWGRTTVRDFGFVRFEPGDVFTEHYWRDRWYAVKEVRAADGTLKGWYCDAARPAEIRPDSIVIVDLELDLWLSADGATILRLDEEEFAESGLEGDDPAAASMARRAMDELEALARAGGFADLLG
ncbi:DUF402 domain-containing protein [Streptomyces chattanoogensis]|uniref:RNA-binding protein AU-1 n=1 Tax=Streptomyces chattanoogensis TaxID=66876 RepID=A0A0N1JVG0_9ACTN|nr:DUF402 domain-containing protein [Streptomyces chattanoogensis]KPC58397.1 RNA-binding protein AU-1 [Streptomyces chattanoogensis]